MHLMHPSNITAMVQHEVAVFGNQPFVLILAVVTSRRWQEEEEDIIDDCTAMVSYLSPAVAAGSTANTNVASRLESQLKLKGHAKVPGPSLGLFKRP